MDLISSLPEGDFRSILARSRWDGKVYAKELLGFDLHNGQERLFDAYLRRDLSAWRAAYLTISTLAGNRAGKTLGVSTAVSHSTLFKMGRKTPTTFKEMEAFLREPYDWYHFGLQQETSELLYHEITKLLQGIHEAQRGNGCPLVDNYLGPQAAETDKKDRGEYVRIKWHPMLGGGEIHFRTTSEKAIGSLGKDMDGISYDECGFDPNFNFIVNEVLHLRRMTTGGQMLLIGTSTEGLSEYVDKWEEGNPDNPLRKRKSMSLRISTRENIGYGVDQDMFDDMLAEMDPRLIPQNIDGIPIEAKDAFFDSTSTDQMFVATSHTPECVPDMEATNGRSCGRTHLPVETMPIPGHRYSSGVDPALTFDSTWAIVLDRTDPKRTTGVWVGRRTGRQTLNSVGALAITAHRTYGEGGAACTTCLDVTGFGGKAIRDVLTGIRPLRGIEFGGTRAKKLRLLLDLKAAIEKGYIKLPREGLWLVLRRQLLSYKLNDKGLETDAVMALALAWSEVQRNKDGRNVSEEFDFFSTPSQERVDSHRGVPTMFSGRRVTILTREGASVGGRRS